MHLTLEGDETGLEVYYQFNQESGSAIEVMANLEGTLSGAVSYVSSGVHVGKGVVTLHTVSSLGIYSNISTSTDYSLDIEFSTVHPNGELLVTYLNMAPLGTQIVDDNRSEGVWLVHNYGTVNTSLDYSMQYNFSDERITTDDLSAYTLHKRGSNEIGVWTSLGVACAVNQSEGTNYAKFCGLNEFSQFVVSSSISPLPVVFLHVAALEISSNKVEISWSTATEKTNDYFTVERSNNTVDFEELGLKYGSGESFSQTDYVFVDSLFETGTVYYRIKQTDFDGLFSYSKVVSINFEEGKRFIVYPNPVNEKLFIESREELTLLLYSNDYGFQETLVEKSEIGYVLDVSFLPEGVYYLRLIGEEGIETRKVMVTN